mmetsp:Transcript_10517/g.32177  ORF Transcript_10517/g.32177 Transcript_10517/m.32177 type:complete len:218 (-) Transcript_10517:802-1455(-)
MEAAVAVKDAEVMVCKIDKARVLTGATSCALRDDVVKGRAIALLLPSGALHRARAHGFREGQIQRTYLQAQVVAPLSLPRCRTQTSAYLAGAAAAAVHFGEHVRVWKHTVSSGPAARASLSTLRPDRILLGPSLPVCFDWTHLSLQRRTARPLPSTRSCRRTHGHTYNLLSPACPDKRHLACSFQPPAPAPAPVPPVPASPGVTAPRPELRRLQFVP